MRMTRNRLIVLKFLCEFCDYGRAPLFKTIQFETGIGERTTIVRTLRYLVQRGFVEPVEGRYRPTPDGLQFMRNPTKEPEIGLAEVARTVCRWHEVTWKEFTSKSLDFEIVAARHEVWFILSKIAPRKSGAIAALSGHSKRTVRGAVRDYKGPDRSRHILAGTTPVFVGRTFVLPKTISERRYRDKLRRTGRYEAYKAAHYARRSTESSRVHNTGAGK